MSKQMAMVHDQRSPLPSVSKEADDKGKGKAEKAKDHAEQHDVPEPAEPVRVVSEPENSSDGNNGQIPVEGKTPGKAGADGDTCLTREDGRALEIGHRNSHYVTICSLTMAFASAQPAFFVPLWIWYGIGTGFCAVALITEWHVRKTLAMRGRGALDRAFATFNPAFSPLIGQRFLLVFIAVLFFNPASYGFVDWKVSLMPWDTPSALGSAVGMFCALAVSGTAWQEQTYYRYDQATSPKKAERQA